MANDTRSLLEQIGPPPPAAGTSSGPSPIGVPAGYTLPPDTNPAVMDALGAAGVNAQGLASSLPSRDPRYWDGDEYLPASLSPTEVARLQRQLEAAGVIEKGTKYRLGVWDEPSRSAYRSLLGYANASGLSIPDAIRRYAESAVMNEEPDAGPTLPTYRISHPDDLRATFESAAKSVIGRTNLDPQQIQRMIQAYQQAELAPQQAVTANQLGGGGGVVTGAPDPGVFAEQQIRQAAPVEASAHDQVTQFESMLDIILNSVGGQG